MYIYGVSENPLFAFPDDSEIFFDVTFAHGEKKKNIGGTYRNFLETVGTYDKTINIYIYIYAGRGGVERKYVFSRICRRVCTERTRTHSTEMRLNIIVAGSAWNVSERIAVYSSTSRIQTWHWASQPSGKAVLYRAAAL